MLTDTVTVSFVSRSAVAGRAYYQDVDVFVFTIVWLVCRAVAKSGLRLGASYIISVIEYVVVPSLPSLRVMPTTYWSIGIVLLSSSCNSDI